MLIGSCLRVFLMQFQHVGSRSRGILSQGSPIRRNADKNWQYTPTSWWPWRRNTLRGNLQHVTWQSPLRCFTHIRRSTFHALLSLVKRKELAPKRKQRGFKAERRRKVVKLMRRDWRKTPSLISSPFVKTKRRVSVSDWSQRGFVVHSQGFSCDSRGRCL